VLTQKLSQDRETLVVMNRQLIEQLRMVVAQNATNLQQAFAVRRGEGRARGRGEGRGEGRREKGGERGRERGEGRRERGEGRGSSMIEQLRLVVTQKEERGGFTSHSF
jgi:hypothetical protein